MRKKDEGGSEKSGRGTHHACTNICLALSEALVVVAARTLPASFSRAWSGLMVILPKAPVALRSGEPPSICGVEYMGLYSLAAWPRYIAMSSVSLEDECTLSVSRG